MICCLNPDCEQPQNPDGATQCQHCQAPLVLLLDHRYRVVKPIGRGGFGKTYLAQDERKLQESCVVKQLITEAQGNQAHQRAVKLFREEAVQLQKLGEEHPQIPTLLAFFEEGPYLYLVQQYVEGPTLAQDLEGQGRWDGERVRRVLEDLLPVLQYIHDRGVIHRDITPNNIIRRRRDGRLVLIDFGISRQLRGSLVTVTTASLGSLGFAAPEQLKDGRVSAAVDLFGLGATCFYLLTGVHPATLWHDEGAGWLKNWRRHVPERLSPEMEKVLDKLLQKEDRNRYASAREALGDLQPPRVIRRQDGWWIVFGSAVGFSLLVKVAQDGLYRLAGSLMGRWWGSNPSGGSTPSLLLDPWLLTVSAFLLSLSAASFVYARQLMEEDRRRKRLAVNVSPQLSPQKSLYFKFEVVTVNGRGSETSRQTKEAEYFDEDLGNGVKLTMVRIPGGKFLRGSPASEVDRAGHEGPQEEVTVPEFFMGKYEVTQAQWRAIMGENPSYFKGENRPVERVSWNDCQEFCRRLSDRVGRTYQLPSEAQWEYACRAGTTTPFHFGETLTTDLANYNGNHTYGSGPEGTYRGEPTEVGSFPANGFGLYDMHGNVWEWCEDVWHDTYQGAPTDGSAWLSSDENVVRVMRGGSWYYSPRHCRSAYRNRFSPGVNYLNYLGFRVVSVKPRAR